VTTKKRFLAYEAAATMIHGITGQEVEDTVIEAGTLVEVESDVQNTGPFGDQRIVTALIYSETGAPYRYRLFDPVFATN
jgi:hypothetical protein